MGLSFLDAMTCGLGAVILLYMVINAAVRQHSEEVTFHAQAEVDRLETEVLDAHRRLVELHSALTTEEKELTASSGLARRMIESVQEIRVELATFDADTLARREHVAQLQTDLKSLEEAARRLSASTPSDETPGDRVRVHVGDGDRQYLTGLKVGGRRILLLVDASASMLGETIVNVIRRRNLPDADKVRAAKWQQALGTVDWLTTQLPRNARFQLYTFAESASPAVADTHGRWLEAGDRATLERAVQSLRGVVPGQGTSLHHAFAVVGKLNPRPDNVILLTDGLPTIGQSRPRGQTVSPRQRAKLFTRAVDTLPSGIPINVLLLPMEGDPMAASAFWKLAIASRGSFMSLSEDWP